MSAFPPEHIVIVRAGGVLVQPKIGFLSNDERMVVRWWVRGKLEPLTARGIIAVEGISDRIIVERVAGLTGRNLDRLGISVIETGGAGDMGPIHKLFGPSGFDIHMSMLIDKDATKKTADKLGIAENDLAQHSVWISDPDLEAEYVAALGADVVWNRVQASQLFKPNELACCTVSGPNGTRTDEDVAAFCRRKGDYKVRAAMAIASVLDATTAAAIGSVNELLSEMVPV